MSPLPSQSTRTPPPVSDRRPRASLRSSSSIAIRSREAAIPPASRGSNCNAASPAIPAIGSMLEQAVGTPAARPSRHRQPEAFEQRRVDESPRPRVQVVQILPRNPARELHRIAQVQPFAQLLQRTREEAVDAAHHQPEFRMLLSGRPRMPSASHPDSCGDAASKPPAGTAPDGAGPPVRKTPGPRPAGPPACAIPGMR